MIPTFERYIENSKVMEITTVKIPANSNHGKFQLIPVSENPAYMQSHSKIHLFLNSNCYNMQFKQVFDTL